MISFYSAIIGFLLLNLIIGLVRIYHGPTSADRLLTVQLFTTTTTAVLLLLAEVRAIAALRDVALVFALLAAVLGVAFVRLSPSTATVGNSER